MTPIATLTQNCHPACYSQATMDEFIAPLASLKLEELQDSPLGLVDLVVDETRSTIRTTSDLKDASLECQTQFVAEFVNNTPQIGHEEAKNLFRFAEFEEKTVCRAPKQVIDFLLKTATFEVFLDIDKKVVFNAVKATAQSNTGQNGSKNAMYHATRKVRKHSAAERIRAARKRALIE